MKTQHHSDRGFTLIELLVVIAIIGILTAVVMANLNTARAKAADASIKENLANLRSQAEIYYSDNGHYGPDVADCVTASTLFAETSVTNIITEAVRVGGGAAICLADDGDPAAGVAASSWAVSVPLKTDPLLPWCVDNNGVARQGTATIVADVAQCV